MNPYSGATFFQTIGLLFSRLAQALFGTAEPVLYPDELQILVLVGVSISAALVGTFLILRRMAMLANALSHTILLGIVMAYVLSGNHHDLALFPTLCAALFMGVVTTFLTQFLTHTTRLQEDASVGIVFTSLFSVGIIAVTALTRNAHVGTEVVMGNVDALHQSDLYLVAWIGLLNVLLFGALFKEYLVTTFDPGLACALGISAVGFDYLLMVQTAATSVGAFRAVGVLMVLAFITGPPLTARLLTDRLGLLLLIAASLGSVASVVGVALSRHLLSVQGVALTTAGVTVMVIVVEFLVVLAGYQWGQRRKKQRIADLYQNS